MKYEPLVLEEWYKGGFCHRLVVTRRGNMFVQFNDICWWPCVNRNHIPKFRRTNARK